jgi:glucose/mannose-6-phosphate isomerase
VAKLLPDGPIDTLGVREAILGLPERLAEAADAGPAIGLPAVTGIDHLVVVAPGEATTAGDIVGVTAGPVATVPVIVRCTATLPAFVAARSLVVVASLDDDPAALGACRTAEDRGAELVVVAPGDSELAGAGRAADAVVVPVTSRSAVGRCDVGIIAVHLLTLLEQLGQLAEVAASTSAAVAQLERRRNELSTDDNDALRLARRIGRTLPLVYGSDELAGAAAAHWKRQVNRNAKAASFAGSLPQLAGDELAGWGQHGDMTRQVFTLVTLRHDHEPAGTAERFALAERLLDEVVHERHQVTAQGDSPLAQLLDLVFYGDLVSWHLAQQLEIDPGPVAALDEMRSIASNP